MKKLFLFVVIFLGLNGFSQAETEKEKPCNQIPVAKPSEKATYKGDLEKDFAKQLPDSFKKAENVSGTFKFIVDCNGHIETIIFKNGNFSNEQQAYFQKKISELNNWTAGKLNDKNVSTYVYLTIDLNKGVLTVKVY